MTRGEYSVSSLLAPSYISEHDSDETVMVITAFSFTIIQDQDSEIERQDHFRTELMSKPIRPSFTVRNRFIVALYAGSDGSTSLAAIDYMTQQQYHVATTLTLNVSTPAGPSSRS